MFAMLYVLTCIFTVYIINLIPNKVYSCTCPNQTCCVQIHFRKLLSNLRVTKINPTPMALMLYDESKILPAYKNKREFNFANRNIIIPQNWKEHGVSAVVWDSAVVLCEYFERNQHLIKSKTILELGAGTGLVGIIAAHLGGRVTITERDVAMDHLKKVVLANVDESHNVTIKELDWTSIHGVPSQSYDLIVGADIIYIEEVFDDLLKTLVKFSDRDTQIYLSCKIRYQRDTRFLNMMNREFTVSRIFYDESRDIVIYRASLKH